MPEKIIILPKNVRERIRAGEVIERPASVVKELVENSIDAKSKRIICEVERGGLERIRVIDDGIGMNPFNLELSLKRYSTSKIKNIDDILHIQTFGFRGEALPSIRAVSELSIESKSQKEETGFLIRTEGEEVVERRPMVRKDGTTVDVRRLFFNTPARRKFLRSESVEFRHIKRVFLALSIENRNIHFTLFNNGSLNLDLPPVSNLKERLFYILDSETVRNLIPFSEDSRGIKIEGVVLKPENAQISRDIQYIFVNRRWIRSNLVRKAIYKAYGNSLWGKHPIFVIEIILPAEELDINVHPTKKEVKFNKEREVFQSTFIAVRNVLNSKENLPSLKKGIDFLLKDERREYDKKEEQSLPLGIDDTESIYKKDRTIPKGFWQLHNSYILASTKTGFMIVDQHAAHERIIFDRIMRRKEPIPPQMLLFPLRLELTIKEEQFFEESIENFYELGFRIKKFSGRTIIIEGIPPFMKEINDVIVHSLFESIMENVSGKEIFNEIAKQVACKSAIKAGEEMKQEEMNRLFDNLFATDAPYTCPHGRPTMIKFTLDELEKKFKRR